MAKENKGKLKTNKELCHGRVVTKKKKQETLHRVAQSIIETFPRLKSPIRPGENKHWEQKTVLQRTDLECIKLNTNVDGVPVGSCSKILESSIKILLCHVV